jgi:hypothetical protein
MIEKAKRWAAVILAVIALALIAGIMASWRALSVEKTARAQVEAQRSVMETAILHKDKENRDLQATVKRLKVRRFEEEVRLPDGTVRRTVSEFTDSEESSTKISDSKETTPDVKLPERPPEVRPGARSGDYPLGLAGIVAWDGSWAAGPTWEALRIGLPFLPEVKLSAGVMGGLTPLGGVQVLGIATIRFGRK